MRQQNKIIFVCEHGAGKSVIAASHFNKLAEERSLDYIAECRGTSPDSDVSAGAKAGLTKDNIFDPRMKPQKLLISDTVNVKRIILFTSLPQDFGSDIKTENWADLPNINSTYDERRDAIVTKINELLDSLEEH